ncbi:MAG: helix-turn-helix transcriptional regulator [Terracidiphilus sp.]
MGNLYRFVEPVVLLLLKQKGFSYGYDLAADLKEHALTDAEIERGALYRTLRQLEMNRNVKSEWETGDGGPARRVYRLTKEGEEHLEEWASVLTHLSKSMTRFVHDARESLGKPPSAKPKPMASKARPANGHSKERRPASTR